MNAVKRHRETKGWSQAELARRADLNATTVSLIETGRFRPYDGQVRKLADALDLVEPQVEELFRQVGDHR